MYIKITKSNDKTLDLIENYYTNRAFFYTSPDRLNEFKRANIQEQK